MQHVIWTFQYKAYSPGLITGMISVACACIINILLIIQGFISVPFYGMFLLGIPSIIKTIKSKHEMPPEIKKIHEIFISLERNLRKLFNK
jgi:hypothetical protein